LARRLNALTKTFDSLKKIDDKNGSCSVKANDKTPTKTDVRHRCPKIQRETWRGTKRGALRSFCVAWKAQRETSDEFPNICTMWTRKGPVHGLRKFLMYNSATHRTYTKYTEYSKIVERYSGDALIIYYIFYHQHLLR